MPYVTEWTEPDLFFTHNGVGIYHTYDDDDAEALDAGLLALPEEP